MPFTKKALCLAVLVGVFACAKPVPESFLGDWVNSGNRSEGLVIQANGAAEFVEGSRVFQGTWIGDFEVTPMELDLWFQYAPGEVIGYHCIIRLVGKNQLLLRSGPIGDRPNEFSTAGYEPSQQRYVRRGE